MKTLLLDRTTWDLCSDASRNIAVASDPYSVTQDVASAVRVFLGECWYDASIGIPYMERVLGKFAPSLFASLATKEAMRVPQVLSARTLLTSFKDRQLTGQVQFVQTTIQDWLAIQNGQTSSNPMVISSTITTSFGGTTYTSVEGRTV
jgi:hypothetical protein